MVVLLQLPTPFKASPSVARDVRFDLLEAPRDRRGTATFFVSVLAHLLLVTVVLVVPLFVADDLVEPTKAVRAFFVAPVVMTPPPPPPPPPAPGVRPALRTKPPAALPTPVETQFRAPVDVPADLPPETAIDLGMDGGVEGGVEGGVAGGVLGGIVGGLVGAPAPGPTVAPVRVGGNIKVPKLVRRVDPVYPRLARDARLNGIVIVEARVDAAGVVRDVKVLRGMPLLDVAAAEAVAQWHYHPLFLNGVPTPFIVVVTVNFNLADVSTTAGR